MEVTDIDGKAISGFSVDRCRPVTGDHVRHRVTWEGVPSRAVLANREIRIRIVADNAALYSIAIGSEEEAARYWEFRIPGFLNMERERRKMQGANP